MSSESLLQLANIVNDRLSKVSLQIPVSIASKRQVSIRFSMNDNMYVYSFTDLRGLNGVWEKSIYLLLKKNKIK